MTESGASIKKAVRFMEQVHDSVYRLIVQADQDMAEHKWVPGPSSKITEGLTNGLSANKEWAISWLMRAYTRSSDKNYASRLHAVIYIDLNPDDFEEPVCFGMVLRYPKELTWAEIWNGCADEFDWLNKLELNGSPKVFGEKEMQEAFPGVQSVGIFALPLLRFEDAAAVAERLVQPLISLALDQANP